MFDYQKVRAIQQFRYGEDDRYRQRRRHKREYRSLGDLLGALAAGLASIGFRRDGGTHPASPAY